MELKARKQLYLELKEVNGIEAAAVQSKCTVEHYRNVMTRIEIHRSGEAFAEIAVEVIKSKRDAQKIRLSNLVNSI